tara:strand:+ start:75505 stop:75924 length:420 start_codon:yes stop_codon:yes gene_type:complete
MNSILLIHIISTVLMTGICWFVQTIHYPLFHEIRIEDFSKYERKNYRTAYLTVPLMVIELFSGIYYFFVVENSKLFFWNLVLLLIIELSTVFFQIPIQAKLSKIYDKQLIKKLILTNWIRTISWTARTSILSIILLKIS